MEMESKATCYDDSFFENYKTYLEVSGDHEALIQHFQDVLPGQFKRIGEGRSSLDVLGVGSGEGSLDANMLTLLQSTFPDVPITTDIVEGSTAMTDDFKALVAKTANLQKIPFTWHPMVSEQYMNEVKAKGDPKTFDFIHMVDMIYYAGDLAETIKFYRSLLKKNGRLMIVITDDGDAANTVWEVYAKEILIDGRKEPHSPEDVIACLKDLGLKYENHTFPRPTDITVILNPGSRIVQNMMGFLTMRDNFNQSFTPEIRADMLNIIRKGSTEKDGKLFITTTVHLIIVHP